MSRIILVRHGPSAHIADERVFDRAGLQRWREAYDTAGIQAMGAPSAALSQLAAAATHVVASDMPRAVESASRLAPSREIQVSSLLRESPLAIPHWPTPLPLIAWATLINLAWMYRIVRGSEVSVSEHSRAAEAADWLAELVADGSTALVVTHGVFRRLVRQQLLARGWVTLQRHGGYRPWSSWHLADSRAPAANPPPTEIVA